MSSVSIVTHRSAELLALAVAARLITRLVDIQSGGQIPSVVLTGGTIADRIHRAVAAAPARDAVAWDALDLWWGDERYLPPGDPDRNETQAHVALLEHVRTSPERVHAMPADDGTDVDTAAQSYAEALRRATPSTDHGESPVFDLLMLGIGPDGHIASLFPEHPALHEQRTVAGVHGSPKPPPTRLTMTLPTLNRAREVWFVVAGENKSQATRLALGGAGVMQVPAAGVHGSQRTLWLLDHDGASQLPPELRSSGR